MRLKPILRTLLYLFCSWLLWLAVFAAGKVGFMLYNRAENPFAFGDVVDVLRHGLSMDMSTAGYLIALPWLYFLIATLFRREPKRRFSWSRRDAQPLPWHSWTVPVVCVIATIAVSAVILGDTWLYPFWKTKLSATIFGYMDDTAGVTNSVSGGFIALRVVIFFVMVCFVSWAHIALWRATAGHPDDSRGPSSPANRWIGAFLLLIVGALDFLAIRGGVGTGVQNVGTAYYSDKLFLNHSAVNPAFSFVTSFKRADDFGSQFQYFDEAELTSIIEPLCKPTPSPVHNQPAPVPTRYGQAPIAAADSTSLLNNTRPNILFVFVEGFGGKFVETLGGLPEVAPNFNRLVNEGVFFDNYYSTSFRTDRGTASLFSGYVSYPTTSLMRLPDKLPHLSSLAQSFADAGYSTNFLYGGDATFAGQQGYLVSNGFKNIVTDKDFSIADAHSGKWGVPDSITAERAFKMVSEELPKATGHSPWLLTYQTLSSHEPFEVDYKRLDDPVLNSFAYVDACIDRLVANLKASRAWDNLLIIIVPDHGFLYNMTYEDPEFFHCPMLWLGGAVKQPRRIKTLMSQSDVAATLLGQLGLPHDNYPWSRDVFSPQYTYPYVYSTFPSGVMFADKTGTVIYDINSESVVTDRPASGTKDAKATEERVRKAKALLQHSYRQLDALR